MSRRQLYHPTNFGEHAADRIVGLLGSWGFVAAQAAVLMFWFTFNSLMVTRILHFDPAPFILCNLFMSAEAAFTGPIILLAQNRQADRDRKRDDLEAQEVQSLYSTHELLLRINRQQLAILKLLEDR